MRRALLPLVAGASLMVPGGSLAAVAEPALPSYTAGDTFIYSDQRVETLVRDDGSALLWRTGTGRLFTRARNFVVPALQWETRGSSGTRRVSGRHEALWPLRAGAAVKFRTVVESRAEGARAQRSAEYWNCECGAAGALAVAAGQFEAVPITCDRFSTATMRVLRRVVWHYSAAVGHYIKRESIDFASGQRTAIELVAALHGREANPAAIRSILSNSIAPR